ncbi:MAG: hypothetical protein KC731_28310, partial [Myxococcales bacterium]|nr:hypothetical protein [Myxococcales bacterium]
MRATILSVMVTTVAFGATGCSKESAPEEGRRTVQPEPRKPAGLESFASLCVGGPAFDGLPRRADGETKKVVTFQKWADDAKPAFARVTPQALASYEPKAASDVGLVACVERKKLDRSRRCSFGQGHYVDYFDMQDHVRIIDPRTGKVVREHDGKTEHRSACPMSYRFTGKSHFDGAPIENRVLSLVLEEQGADAPLPKMPAKYEMYQVCGGVPYPQLPAYDPKSDDYQAIAYSARGPESYSTSVGRLEDEGEDIRLVACVERKADDTKTSSCAFRG